MELWSLPVSRRQVTVWRPRRDPGSGARAGVDAGDPAVQRRVAGERHVVDEHPMERIAIVRRDSVRGIFEERERGHVGKAEVAEEVVATVEQRLEQAHM